jgi:flagellar biosynthesis protein FlhF
MNVRRFTARTSREALSQVREALGEDAVVLSTRPGLEGVEILAMAPDSLLQAERLAMAGPPTSEAQGRAQEQPAASQASARASGNATAQAKASVQANASGVADDVATLSMSTLSFQDYVRERLLRRRRAALGNDAALRAEAEPAQPAAPVAQPARPRVVPSEVAASMPPASAGSLEEEGHPARHTGHSAPHAVHAAHTAHTAHPGHEPHPVLHDTAEPACNTHERGLLDPRMAQGDAGLRGAPSRSPASLPLPHERLESEIRVPSADAESARRDQDMLNELRQVKGLIEERFGALAFIEKLQRQPGQALLAQSLLDCGFSPALIRKLTEGLPHDAPDTTGWAAAVLERNLLTHDAALEDQGGVYALIGATGVGKTTTTAKIAAAFATQYGAANLGLITLDAYRVGAHEQLRAYGRILGVPVHTAHDRASLEDLLELLTAKKMVLVDTAGMAQRDTRTRELLEMLSHRAIRKLLVVNAASQGETIEDVLGAYRAASCAGVVLSKLDEAVKLGPALDALIRHKLRLVGVANGQRVPEDWHRLSANALVHRALRGGGGNAWRLDASDVSLIFTAPQVSRLQPSAMQV